jgi:fibronectin type 3 domain-containing protein
MKKLSFIFLSILTFSLILVSQASNGFTKLANVSGTTYSDPTCPNQSTCYYQVTSVDSTGHESTPATCGTTSLCFNGNQSVAIMPSSGVHSVVLTWGASSTTGVTYNVYQHIGPFPASGLNNTVN